MADSYKIDASGFDEFGRTLNRLAGRVEANAAKPLLEIAGKVMVAAKALASQHSSTIAGTIRIRPMPVGMGVGAVMIEAGGENDPLPILFEVGNKGSRRSEWAFRHPVWAKGDRATWTWVEQSKHPYLRPAIAVERKHTTATLERSWEMSLRESGMRRL